jgi:hypothetical protein
MTKTEVIASRVSLPLNDFDCLQEKKEKMGQSLAKLISADKDGYT